MLFSRKGKREGKEIALIARACYNLDMNRKSESKNMTPRVSLTLLLTGIGFVCLSIWAEPLKLDFTPGFGLMQIIGILLGITLVAAAGYLFTAYRRDSSQEISLLSDIGMRLGLTGLLACYVAGLADMVGVGTHRGSLYERPFLGPLQLAGLVMGSLIVGGGLLLYWLGSSRKGQGGKEPE